MPEDQAGSQGSLGLEGQAGSAGQATETGLPDWGSIKTSLGELGNDKAFEPIKDVKGLAESFVNSQKMIGRGIFLPDEKAKPEDKQKAIDGIKKKLKEAGVLESTPATPEEYQINFPEVDRFGNKLQPNQPLVDSFRLAAHKLQLTPSVAQGLLDWYLNFQAEADASEDREFETMKANLKKEWGGLYTRRMEASRRAIAKYLGEEGDEIISHLPPAVGRKLVFAFSQIGEPMLEDELISGGPIAGVVTKEQVKAKIDAMFNDPKSPLNDISHRQHNEAVQEFSNLQQQYIRLGGK